MISSSHSPAPFIQKIKEKKVPGKIRMNTIHNMLCYLNAILMIFFSNQQIILSFLFV